MLKFRTMVKSIKLIQTYGRGHLVRLKRLKRLGEGGTCQNSPNPFTVSFCSLLPQARQRTMRLRSSGQRIVSAMTSHWLGQKLHDWTIELHSAAAEGDVDFMVSLLDIGEECSPNCQTCRCLPQSNTLIFLDAFLSSVVCCLLSVVCCLLSVVCCLFSVLCSLFSVLCSLFSVLCSLFSVLCSLFSVLFQGDA
jgi:hypothetical protein